MDPEEESWQLAGDNPTLTINEPDVQQSDDTDFPEVTLENPSSPPWDTVD